MKNTADFTFLRHEQPSEHAWNEVNAFAVRWNDGSEPKFSRVADFLWMIKFPDQNTPTVGEFLRGLKTLQDRYAVKYHATSQATFGEDDYRTADFVEILGISLEGFPGRPFVLNEKEALDPPTPCPECGWQDMFSAPQRAFFAIDEALLDQALPEGGGDPVGGWDCVNLPNGHKLVSQRIVALLKNTDVRGYELLPVHTADTNVESGRMYQLLARRAILVLHWPRQTGPETIFCSSCGAVRSLPAGYEASSLQLAQEFCVSKGELKGDEMFSRHPSRGAMLYIAQRVYQLLLDARLNGIVSNDAIKLCVP